MMNKYSNTFADSLSSSFATPLQPPPPPPSNNSNPAIKQRTREEILEDFLSCREIPLSERRTRSAGMTVDPATEPVTRTLNLPQNFVK